MAADDLFTLCRCDPVRGKWEAVTNGCGVPYTARAWQAAQGDLYMFAHWVHPGATFGIFQNGALIGAPMTVSEDKEKPR